MDPQLVLDHCVGQLAHYKCPKDVFVVSEQPLPLNPTEKLVKGRIREALAAGTLS